MKCLVTQGLGFEGIEVGTPNFEGDGTVTVPVAVRYCDTQKLVYDSVADFHADNQRPI